METALVSTDFSLRKFSHPSLNIQANHVLKNMEGNPYFPSPEPAMGQFRAAIASYRAAIARAEDGRKQDTVIKRDQRKIIEKMLKSLAAYVQQTSGGSESIIATSGFDVHKKRVRLGELGKPHELRVRPGINHGSVEAKWRPVGRARNYEFAYREASAQPGNNWNIQTSTKCKVLVEGLTSGTKYTFRVAASGSHPSRIWSDEISSYVL
jgi:hypothetical protein